MSATLLHNFFQLEGQVEATLATRQLYFTGGSLRVSEMWISKGSIWKMWLENLAIMSYVFLASGPDRLGFESKASF